MSTNKPYHGAPRSLWPSGPRTESLRWILIAKPIIIAAAILDTMHLSFNKNKLVFSSPKSYLGVKIQAARQISYNVLLSVLPLVHLWIYSPHITYTLLPIVAIFGSYESGVSWLRMLIESKTSPIAWATGERYIRLTSIIFPNNIDVVSYQSHLRIIPYRWKIP